jgi:16S rRNA G966 N2-methylase RsmD
MTDLVTNVLYYGDNLDILRRYLPDAAVDLVYLDPPFNSNRDYNVIFRDESGNATDAQLLAFEDTWHSVASYLQSSEAGTKVRIRHASDSLRSS